MRTAARTLTAVRLCMGAQTSLRDTSFVPFDPAPSYDRKKKTSTSLREANKMIRRPGRGLRTSGTRTPQHGQEFLLLSPRVELEPSVSGGAGSSGDRHDQDDLHSSHDGPSRDAAFSFSQHQDRRYLAEPTATADMIEPFSASGRTDAERHAAVGSTSRHGALVAGGHSLLKRTMRPQKLSEVHGSSFYGSKQAPATPLRARRKQEHDEPHHGALDGGGSAAAFSAERSDPLYQAAEAPPTSSSLVEQDQDQQPDPSKAAAPGALTADEWLEDNKSKDTRPSRADAGSSCGGSGAFGIEHNDEEITEDTNATASNTTTTTATASTEHGGKNDERHHDEAPEDERHHYEAPKDEHERHHDGGGVERVKLRGKSGTEEVRLKCKQGKGAEKTYTLSKTAKYYDLPCDFVGAGEEFTIEYIYDKFLANGPKADVFVTEQYDNQGDKDRHKQPFLIKSESTHFAHDEPVPGTSCPKYNTRGDQHDGIRCAMIQDGLLAWRKLYTLKVKVRENTRTTTTTTTATAVLLMQDGANCETGWQPMGRSECVAGPTVKGKKYTYAADEAAEGQCRNQWWPNYGCFLWQGKAYFSTCLGRYGQSTYNNLPPPYAHLGICVPAPAPAPPARVLKQNDANCETGWQPMGRDECVFGPTVEGGKKYTYTDDVGFAGECRTPYWPNTGCFVWNGKAYFSTCQGRKGQSGSKGDGWGLCVPSPGVKVESRKQVQKKKQVPRSTKRPTPLRSKQNRHQPQLEKENHNAREKREEETKRNKKADHSNADGMGTSRGGAVDHSAEVEKGASRNATTGSAAPKDELRDDDEQGKKDDDRPAFPLLLAGIFIAAAVCFGCLGAICVLGCCCRPRPSEDESAGSNSSSAENSRNIREKNTATASGPGGTSVALLSAGRDESRARTNAAVTAAAVAEPKKKMTKSKKKGEKEKPTSPTASGRKAATIPRGEAGAPVQDSLYSEEAHEFFNMVAQNHSDHGEEIEKTDFRSNRKAELEMDSHGALSFGLIK